MCLKLAIRGLCGAAGSNGWGAWRCGAQSGLTAWPGAASPLHPHGSDQRARFQRQWPCTTFPAQAFISCPASLSDPRGSPSGSPLTCPQASPEAPRARPGQLQRTFTRGPWVCRVDGRAQAGRGGLGLDQVPHRPQSQVSSTTGQSRYGTETCGLLAREEKPRRALHGTGLGGKDGVPWPLWLYFKTLLHLHLPILPRRG